MGRAHVKALWVGDALHVDPGGLHVEGTVVESDAVRRCRQVTAQVPLFAKDLLEFNAVEARQVADVGRVLRDEGSEERSETSLAQVAKLRERPECHVTVTRLDAAGV